MISLTIREMRAALTRLDEILASEGEILVTKRGHAIARLVSVRPAASGASHADLRARMPRLTVPSEVLVRQDRDALRLGTAPPRTQDIRFLKGIIRHGKRRAVSVEEMNEAIAEGLAKT